MLESLYETNGETCLLRDDGRSQRPNSTNVAELGERRGQQNQVVGSGSGRKKRERWLQVADER